MALPATWRGNAHCGPVPENGLQPRRYPPILPSEPGQPRSHTKPFDSKRPPHTGEIVDVLASPPARGGDAIDDVLHPGQDPELFQVHLRHRPPELVELRSEAAVAGGVDQRLHEEDLRVLREVRLELRQLGEDEGLADRLLGLAVDAQPPRCRLPRRTAEKLLNSKISNVDARGDLNS